MYTPISQVFIYTYTMHMYTCKHIYAYKNMYMYILLWGGYGQ